LSRDGTAKVNGIRVGFWWVDGNDLYHFDLKRPDDPSWNFGVVSGVLRHMFIAEIPRYLASVGKLPPHRVCQTRHPVSGSTPSDSGESGN
jgi:hypothetical protein